MRFLTAAFAFSALLGACSVSAAPVPAPAGMVCVQAHDKVEDGGFTHSVCDKYVPRNEVGKG